MTFRVVDKTTGEEPDCQELALKFHKDLIYCDIESFAILEDGALILCDECGSFDYVDLDAENLKVVFE
ncbi:hypothetical protein FACS1894151_10580 [Spirochaetia bacterium]|nr:hypothetical protein FACS1894151_10580 [Spirochaetia bacterium]